MMMVHSCALLISFIFHCTQSAVQQVPDTHSVSDSPSVASKVKDAVTAMLQQIFPNGKEKGTMIANEEKRNTICVTSADGKNHSVDEQKLKEMLKYIKNTVAYHPFGESFVETKKLKSDIAKFERQLVLLGKDPEHSDNIPEYMTDITKFEKKLGQMVRQNRKGRHTPNWNPRLWARIWFKNFPHALMKTKKLEKFNLIADILDSIFIWKFREYVQPRFRWTVEARKEIKKFVRGIIQLPLKDAEDSKTYEGYRTLREAQINIKEAAIKTQIENKFENTIHAVNRRERVLVGDQRMREWLRNHREWLKTEEEKAKKRIEKRAD